MFKLETERPGRGRSSSSGLSDFSSRTREVEMEHEVKRLKQVEAKPSRSIAFGACLNECERFCRWEMLKLA